MISLGQETYFSVLVAPENADLEEVAAQSHESLMYVPYRALGRKLRIGKDESFDYLSAYIDAHGIGDNPVKLPLAPGG